MTARLKEVPAAANALSPDDFLAGVHQAFFKVCTNVLKLIQCPPHVSPDNREIANVLHLPTYDRILESVKFMSMSVLMVSSMQQHLIANKQILDFSCRSPDIAEVLDTLQRVQIRPPPRSGKGQLAVAHAKNDDDFESKKKDGYMTNPLALVVKNVENLLPVIMQGIH